MSGEWGQYSVFFLFFYIFIELSVNTLEIKGFSAYIACMFDDDLDPQTKKSKPKDLSTMSVEELKEYVQDLKEEIVRVETEIDKKASYSQQAESFFKS